MDTRQALTGLVTWLSGSFPKLGYPNVSPDCFISYYKGPPYGTPNFGKHPSVGTFFSAYGLQ